MKNIQFLRGFMLMLFISTFFACRKESLDLGLRSDNAVYTTMTPTPLEAPTVAITASGSQTIPDVSFRVYVNLLYDSPVTVTFSLTGTAVIGTNYTYSGNYQVTIPTNTRYVDIPVKVINGSLGTSTSRTIILTLLTASNDFLIGIGTGNKGYTKSTYTITKP